MPQRNAVDPISALRHPGFLIYTIGGLISNAGSQMRMVAVQWEIYQRDPDPMYLGYIGLALVLPILLFALPAGAAADRYSRRWLIGLAQIGMTACGAGLAWASWSRAPLPLIYLLLFGSGTCRGLGWPASTAIVTGLVPDKIFSNAAMWRSNTYQFSSVVGPMVGGLLLAKWNPATVFLVDAASSMVLAVCMLFVRPRPQKRVIEPHSWRAVLQGIHYLRRQPVILSTMTLDMVAVLFGGVVALLPIFATRLGVTELGFGWMRAMPAIGSISMGILLALRPPIRRAGRTILWTVVAFGLATILFGVSTSFPLSLFALFALGAADNISVVIRQTVLQLMTPDSMRGRVTAVSTIFISSSNELGEFESGLMAKLMGVVPSVVFGGSVSLLSVPAVAFLFPDLLKLGSLEHLEPAEPAEAVV
jgi:MFS family permease